MQLQKTDNLRAATSDVCWGHVNSIALAIGDLPSPKKTGCRDKGKEAIIVEVSLSSGIPEFYE